MPADWGRDDPSHPPARYLVQVYFSWWRVGHVFTGNISIFLALVYIGLSMAAITYLIPTRQ